MIELTVKKFNDFTRVCPVVARIEVKEINQDIPSINIFRHDVDSQNFMKVDISGDDGQYHYSTYYVEEGFLTPEEAEVFIKKTLSEIREEVNRHRGSQWENEEEYIVEI